MKTRALKKHSATVKNVPKIGCTFIPANPTRQVARKLKNQDDGKNDHAAEIENIFNSQILPVYQSFNLSTAIQLTAHVNGAGVAEVTELFEAWTRQLEREGRIKKSPLFENMFLQLV